MDEVDSVATMFVRLSRPLIKGWPRPSLTDPIVRAALLLDLALLGRLTPAESSVEVNVDPTGSAATDQLLNAVADGPSRQLSWWLDNAPVGVRDVADDLVSHRLWQRHGLRRQYTELDPASASVQLAAISSATASHSPTGASALAVAALMQLLPAFGADGGRTAVELASECGDATWLAVELIGELARRRSELDSVSKASSASDVLNSILY